MTLKIQQRKSKRRRKRQQFTVIREACLITCCNNHCKVIFQVPKKYELQYKTDFTIDNFITYVLKTPTNSFTLSISAL